MRKKVAISVMLTICLGVSLGGCGSSDDTGSPNEGNEQQATVVETTIEETTEEVVENNPKTMASFQILKDYFNMKKESASDTTSYVNFNDYMPNYFHVK